MGAATSRDGEADADAAAVGEKIALLMPITLPAMSNIGPPSCRG